MSLHRKSPVSSKFFLCVLTPIFFAANCKDPCKKPFLNEEECQALDTDSVIEIVEPTVELRVVSIDPDIVDPGVSVEATIYGKGFEEGAMISIGDETYASGFDSAEELSISLSPLDSGLYDVVVSNPSGGRHTLYEGLQVGSLAGDEVQTCEDIVVYFDLNKDRLTVESEQKILAQSECWLKTGVPLVVEGHCDERGTTEYNIALGQRRADAVQRYLLTQGITSGNMRTVSHGEERPAVSGQSESAYQQNRRAEIHIQQ